MKNNLSPYPPNVRINGDNVFLDERYMGFVDKVQNWGKDFFARPDSLQTNKPNKFFSTKTEAVKYIIS
jgi:hypothetical protein